MPVRETHPLFFFQLLKAQQWLGYDRSARISWRNTFTAGNFFKVHVFLAISSFRLSSPLAGRLATAVLEMSLNKERRWWLDQIFFILLQFLRSFTEFYNKNQIQRRWGFHITLLSSDTIQNQAGCSFLCDFHCLLKLLPLMSYSTEYEL